MTKAEKIVETILEDLQDRRGLRQEFDQIDEEVMTELKETLIEKVETVLKENE